MTRLPVTVDNRPLSCGDAGARGQPAALRAGGRQKERHIVKNEPVPLGLYVQNNCRHIRVTDPTRAGTRPGQGAWR